MNYFQKRRNAFKYAFSGLAYVFRYESHAKLHALAALLVIAAAVYFDVNIFEWLVLLLCIALVLSLEIINSAIEKLTDIAAPEFSENAGRVKDMAAAGVLVASVISAVIGALIFIPKLF